MASRRITRETFEAVVQDKVKRYRMERSGAAGDSIHHFKAAPRPPPRPRYGESFPDSSGRFPAANCQHEDWGDAPREDYPREDYPGENYPGPSYRPASPLLRHDSYFHEQFAGQREFGRDYGRPAPQNREFGRAGAPSREYGHPHSREYGQPNREYGRDRDYGHGPGDSWEGGGQHEAEFGPSEVLGDFRSPGLMEEEYGSAENEEYEAEFGAPPRRGGVGRGRVLRGKRLARGVAKPKTFKGDLKTPLKKWNVKKPQPGLDPKALDQPLDVAPQQRPQHPKLPPHPLAAQRPLLRLPKPAHHAFRSLSFDLVDKSDIFSTFGMEIIKWAGFHAIKNDAEFSRLFGALFELETETCAKMLASFKCSLRPEHRDYCFFTIKSLQHAALKTPKVDNEFLNMLLDKGAVKTKNCFFEVIKPFDKYIMRLQDRLLKGVTPLLMACNAYELSLKTSGFGDPRDMAGAFETTVSLCRKSLALLGQTFALASVFRQEKILEAVGLQEMAPAPTSFPNFDDSTLFGREYIENLKAWLEKSGYPIQVRRAQVGPAEQLQAASADSKAPQRADRKVVDTIEQLVSSIVSGNSSAKDRNAQKSCPEYWFLSDEESLEYKYFRLRLAEAQRRSLAGAGAVPGGAPEAVRALLYARRVASIKRKLFKNPKKLGIVPGLRGCRARRARRASTGTQTLLTAPGKNWDLEMGLEGAPSAPSAQGAAGPEGLAAAAELCPPLGSQFADVDAKTMETAEKLAKFVAQVGPEIEQFSIDNSADNPDLWFLQDQSSPAFQFYRMKVYELCPSITFTPRTPQSPQTPGRTPQLSPSSSSSSSSSDAAESEPRQPPDGDDDDDDDDEDEAAGSRGPELQQELQPPAAEQLQLQPRSPEGPAPPAPGARFPRKRVSSKALKVGMIPASKRVCLIEEPKASRFCDAKLSSKALKVGMIPASKRVCLIEEPKGVSLFKKWHFCDAKLSSKALKVGMIPASKRVCLIEEPKVHEPVRIAYDRPRGCPVTKKKKKGRGVELCPKRLSPRNVGFQMLQRMGWQEGHGLGTRGRGIREPVHLGATSAGEGLGVAGEENQEDAFDIFRQRMIQMYRQKRANK